MSDDENKAPPKPNTSEIWRKLTTEAEWRKRMDRRVAETVGPTAPQIDSTGSRTGSRKANAESEGPAPVLNLSKNTLVPLGSVLTIVAILVKLWLGYLDEEAAQNAELQKIRETMKEFSRTHWTCQQKERFIYEIRLLNPTLSVPTTGMECGGESR